MAGRTMQRQTAGVFSPLLQPARYKGAFGGRGCLHPDALIDTPNGQVRVSDFNGGDVYSWHNGEVVIATATAAVEYTEEDLFEVTLADGSQIIATDQHKFLTGRGWVELSDLSTSDAVVVARHPARLSRHQTNLGSGLSGFPRGVRHWTQKPEDYLGDCSEYLRRYGQQLRSEADSDLTFPPSPSDERQHNSRGKFHLGDLASYGIGIPSFPFRRASSRGALPFQAGRYCAALGSHSAERIFEWPSVFFQWPRLSHVKTSLILPSPISCWPRQAAREIQRSQAKTLQRLLRRLRRVVCDIAFGVPFSSPSVGNDFTLSSVRLIRKHSRLKYWDLHVWGTNNYLSNGIVNHNSGKSHFFAEQMIEDALRWPGIAGEGLRAVCVREVQKSLKQSAKRLLEDKLTQFELGEADGFKVFNEVIETPRGGIISFTGMQDHTADSVKSLEGYHRAWVEEAQSLSDRSLTLLRPTIRWEDESRGLASELLFSWNPSRPTDPVDMLLRGDKLPTGATVVKANWSDNPWFPKVLEQERLDDLANRPDRYPHIWEGDYATALEGAYYAEPLATAQLEGRIGFVARESLNKTYAIWDIGGTSRKSDATAIWIVQFIGTEVRLLDYYEAVGQPFEAHVYWLRGNKYEDAVCVLPHDGVKHDTVHAVTPDGYLQQAGFATDLVPNQGAGAAMMRIEAARQMFPHCRFNAEKTKAGREALGWYHERRDEKRNIGLGPEHDFASHCADAFGLIAVYRERIRSQITQRSAPIRRNIKGLA